jgi:hypothetical protein
VTSDEKVDKVIRVDSWLSCVPLTTHRPTTPERSAGFIGKFKEMWTKYGWVFVGTYGAVWATTLSTFYVLVDQGFMQSNDFDDDAAPNPFNPLELLNRVRLVLLPARIDVCCDGSATVAVLKWVSVLRSLVARVLNPGRFASGPSLRTAVAHASC